MANMLADAMAWLQEQVEGNASVEVTYSRGVHSVTWNATLGKTLLKLDDGYGRIRMEWTDRDFIGAAADLILNGVATLPVRGDQVSLVLRGKTMTYLVAAPGGEPEWRWVDPHETMLRVHGKLIATV